MVYAAGMENTSLIDNISLPLRASAGNSYSTVFLQDFQSQAERLEDASLADAAKAFSSHVKGANFLAFISRHSQYLSQLILRQMPFFAVLCQQGVTKTAEALHFTLENEPSDPAKITAALMKHLRILKSQAALLAAVADLGGIWTTEEVTRFLSILAAKTLQQAVDFLLRDAYTRGELPHIDPLNPSQNSGLIVLGMGKLGAFELNYSSDIDLIILFEAERMRYGGKQSLQHCMSRITRELVHIMQERTADGYVFRTDIRLRPDPASTPPALSVGAAITYYETTGQNWERAAMIKARPVAGDIGAGERFLKSLTPFIWRRNLDFAAIADIHSIKRQIDHRTGNAMRAAGHNLKLGAGGIREIEFFVQIQQLIWGGRNSGLRSRATCDTLYGLAGTGVIQAQDAIDLKESYYFLRELEHRVQMQRDQQSHSLPTDPAALEEFALFAGYESLAAFEAALLFHLQRVKSHYTKLYGVEESLGADGSLVFTGVEPDPETINTLSRMGFKQSETVCERIANWHRGHRRATRNKRARERLTEITPDLLKALSNTANPDAAFIKFDEFLGKLPAGVQIFSLFAANPQLLKLIADIMGSAPALAETLSRNPSLLDAVLTGAFYEPLPDKSILQEQLAQFIKTRASFDDMVNILCQFKNEKSFQAGIQLLKGVAGSEEIGYFLSDLADIILTTLVKDVGQQFAETYGGIAGSQMAIIAMGKLGARELTFASDLDLIFVYDAPSPDAMSDGEKSFTASVYFNRLFQRLVGVLTSLTREGRLYEIDTRLRPLGTDGPLAASYNAYDQYFDESAWMFEFMALTRARILLGEGGLKEKLESSIYRHLARERTIGVTRFEVSQMRQKVVLAAGTDNPWNIKYIRGGLMDIDFVNQYLLLIHQKPMQELEPARRFFTHLLHLLRLCSDGSLDEATAPEGLKSLLYTQLGFEDFEALKTKLLQTERQTYTLYQMILGQEFSYD